MVGFAARVLPVGLALTGALLATTGLPGTGSTATMAPAATASAVPSTVAAPAPVLSPSAATTAPSVATATASPTSAAVATPTTPTTTTAPAQVRTVVPAGPSRSTTTTRTPPRAAARAAADVCSGPGWEKRRGAAALASLEPAAANGYSLTFMGAKSGFYGLTRPSLRAVEVYVRSCSAESTELLRHVLAHELGHAYDKTVLTDAQRAAYKRARGIPASTPWYGCHRCTDFAIPAGDFAEVYSQWRRGATTNRSQIGDAPSAAELEVLATQFFGA